MVKLIDNYPPGPSTKDHIPEQQSTATKQDIEDLGDKLVWPPTFTRDLRLRHMQKVLNEEDAVMQNTSLSDTEKVLRVAQLKQQYNVHDRELFGAKRLGAVPTKPLPTMSPNDSPDIKQKAEDDSDVLDETGSDEEEEYEEEYKELEEKEIEDQSSSESLSDDSDLDHLQDGYTVANIIKSVPQHRRAKATKMLKKLAADRKITWDDQGEIYYRHKQITGANIGQLVKYFQTAHKKKPLPSPIGKRIFGHALRKADAMDDILLGGKQDDSVHKIFIGHSPKTPRFTSTMPATQFSTPIKRQRLDDSKVVDDWAF